MGFFLVMIIRQQKRTRELYRSKIQAEITTLERERSRIAADLHDELGPILSSVKLRMNCLDLQTDADRREVDRMNQHIDDIISRMRGISNDLMPSVLLRKGLVPAMHEFVSCVQKRDSLQVHLEASRVPDIPSENAVHIYRIFQEVVHNAIKYSDASTLEILLAVRGDRLMLSASDNGAGFDRKAALKKGGLGLRNLLSRTEMIGGEMYLESIPGKGTAYEFSLPLQRLL
jgi:signal transduction histidine kinase